MFRVKLWIWTSFSQIYSHIKCITVWNILYPSFLFYLFQFTFIHFSLFCQGRTVFLWKLLAGPRNVMESISWNLVILTIHLFGVLLTRDMCVLTGNKLLALRNPHFQNFSTECNFIYTCMRLSWLYSQKAQLGGKLRKQSIL